MLLLHPQKPGERLGIDSIAQDYNIFFVSSNSQRIKSATNVTVDLKPSHSTSETIVISETDAAKIAKNFEFTKLFQKNFRQECFGSG